MNPLDTGDLFAIEFMNPNPTSSKTKDGPKYRVAFELHKDDWQMFMDTNTAGMILEFQGRVAEKNAGPIPEKGTEIPKGGPISKNAGILCGDPLANTYAKEFNFKDFTEMIYSRCGINSRSYLDHDEIAKAAYEALKSEYFQWANN